MDIKHLFSCLCTRFSFPHALKDEQINAINVILQKRNLICILPTGFGKSLIYVIPPLILDEV